MLFDNLKDAIFFKIKKSFLGNIMLAFQIFINLSFPSSDISSIKILIRIALFLQKHSVMNIVKMFGKFKHKSIECPSFPNLYFSLVCRTLTLMNSAHVTS